MSDPDLNPLADVFPEIPPPQPPSPISAKELAAITDVERPFITGGIHAALMIQPPLADAMHRCRLLGYAKAREDSVHENEVVVILAHDDTYEVFFKDHPKLDIADVDRKQPIGTHRERMLKALTPDETREYEILVETEKRETDPTKIVDARAARMAWEVAWATDHWRWKRYAHYFVNGSKWTTWFVYRSDLAEDPITKDTDHPWTNVWNDMTKLVPAGDGCKFLVIAGNMASVQIGMFPTEKEDTKGPEFQTAEEYEAFLRARAATAPTRADFRVMPTDKKQYAIERLVSDKWTAVAVFPTAEAAQQALDESVPA